VPALMARRLEGERFRLERLVLTRTLELEAKAENLEREMAERKRLQAKVVKAQRMETAGRLAGGVAHEFNNLLASVLGHAQLLREDLRGADEHVEQDIAEIEDAVGRGSRLVSQLLGFTRRQPVREQIIDVAAVVKELHSLLLSLLGPGLILEIQAEPGQARVTFDPAQLRQVITNLAANAVDAMDAMDAMDAEGTLTISVAKEEIASSYTGETDDDIPAGAYVPLTISDTGHGMDREVLRRAFEPFFTTKDPSATAGLGLSVAYGAVRQFGGWMDVKSRLGSGTTVRIFLPPAQD